MLYFLAAIGSLVLARAAAIARSSSAADNTVYYTLNLTHGQVSPAGVSRTAILINGETPGPDLEMDEGQTLSVLVYNHLDDEATVHFHGLKHEGVPWMDGVPGVTQYPIPPGGNFTYTITPTDQYGQYWYHSHYKSQLADGLRGTLFIRPSPSRDRPFHLISNHSSTLAQLKAAERQPETITLVDWQNKESTYYDQLYLDSGADPLCVDAYLINGKGQQICPDIGFLQSVAFPYILPVTGKGCVYPNSTILQSATAGRNYTIEDPFYPGLYDTFVPCDPTYSEMTVINVDADAGYMSVNLVFAGSLYEKKFSIDGHKLIVYAADGQYVEPKEVDVILGAIGERYQAFVKLDNPGNWTIRLSNQDYSAQSKSGYAVLSYTNASDTVWTSIPDTPASSQAMDYGGNLINNATIIDPLTLVPYPALPAPAAAHHTLFMYIGQPDPRVWVLDGIAYLPWRQDDTPAIIDPQLYLDAGVAASVPNGSVVDIVFILEPGNPIHPMHKHDVKSWIIGQGSGAFNWSTVAEAYEDVPGDFNFATAPYRDTYRTPLALESPAWMAVRYQAVTPGPVFMHCHISNHLAAGMAFVVMQGLEVGFPQLPQAISDVPHSIISANPMPTLTDGYVYATAR